MAKDAILVMQLNVKLVPVHHWFFRKIRNLAFHYSQIVQIHQVHLILLHYLNKIQLPERMNFIVHHAILDMDGQTKSGNALNATELLEDAQLATFKQILVLLVQEASFPTLKEEHVEKTY